jgi:hypothetical protein
MVQELPSLQSVGHSVVGSQVSPGSAMPLPQSALQSVSRWKLQPAGQQPSPFLQLVIDSCWQAKLHCAALPIGVSAVQAVPSSQPLGHELDGSHVSPGSKIPLSQVPLLQPPSARQAGPPPSPVLAEILLSSNSATRLHPAAAIPSVNTAKSAFGRIIACPRPRVSWQNIAE